MTLQEYGAVLAALLVTVALPKQDDVVDRGTFTITRDGAVIGHETFTLRRTPATTPGEAGGFSLTTSATFPSDRGSTTRSAQADFGADSLPAQLQVDQTGGAGAWRLTARFTSRRVTVRQLSAARETGRDYATGDSVIVAPDSLFAFYLLRSAAAIALFNPMDGRSSSARGTATTTDSATTGGVSRILTHVTLGTAPDTRELWYDESGKLVAVEIPRLRLRAQR